MTNAHEISFDLGCGQIFLLLNRKDMSRPYLGTKIKIYTRALVKVAV